MGDVVRRLVARTMAKQVSKQVEAATAPFQYALSTKAGCECVAHILQCVTDGDPEATVISIDGVGVRSDLQERDARRSLEDGEWGSDPPFVRCFCGSPSTCLWEDEMGVTQNIQ